MRVGTVPIAFDDARPAIELMPSFRSHIVPLPPIHEFRPTNPSVALWNGTLWMTVRALNYYMDFDDPAGTKYVHFHRSSSGRPQLRTRNLLVRLDAALQPDHVVEISAPVDWPEPQFAGILGMEDSRLFNWDGELWCVSSVRELHTDGMGRMVLARIEGAGSSAPRFADWRVLDPGGVHRDEKNWMPQVAPEGLRFVYTVDPTRTLDHRAATRSEHPRRYAESNVMRGGSAFVLFQGGWLGLVHELVYDGPLWYYYHRFVWMDAENVLRRLSSRFFFVKVGIEFAAGLCWSSSGERLVMSYGVDDLTSNLAVVDPAEVAAILGDARPTFAGSADFLPIR